MTSAQGYRDDGRRRCSDDPLPRGGPWPTPIHRAEGISTAGAAELVDEHRDQPGAAHAQRVAERDGTAVDVHLRRIEAKLTDAGDRLAGEGLVELDEVEILDAEAGALERLAGGRDGPDPHDGGIHAGDSGRDHPGQRLQPELAGDAGFDQDAGPAPSSIPSCCSR
jgi:hypothetical protein